MSNQQLNNLIGQSGKLIFINKYGYVNALHGKLSKAGNDKFAFQVHGSVTILIEASRVIDFEVIELEVKS